MTNNEPDLEFREGEYGEKVLAVEPGGIEAIPDSDRHGKAIQLLFTWASPNLEFATIYVGALAVIFGLSFTQAVIGILIGNLLGSAAHYSLTQDGPRYGVPQMLLGRAAFGKIGNALPSIFNAGAAGIGWFAVNSVSGAFALASLAHLSNLLSLIIDDQREQVAQVCKRGQRKCARDAVDGEPTNSCSTCVEDGRKGITNLSKCSSAKEHLRHTVSGTILGK
ncbi:MAG: cytosine permease [Actinomycetes bacterium]